MDNNLYCAEELYASISRRKEALEKLIKQKEEQLEHYPPNVRQGSIKASYAHKDHKADQYYWRMPSSGKSGKYIKKTPENMKFIKYMIQKEYDEKLLSAAKEELKYLNDGGRFFGRNPLLDVFDSMGAVKQKWISPIFPGEEEYAKKWSEEPFDTAHYKKESRSYKTKQGEYVRSKSELLIANSLFEHKIPYRYECPLKDNDHIWALPDFTVLNTRRRREYYWEHFGMMGDTEYTENALKKIRNYEKHHMFPGTEVIMTFESSQVQIDLESIEDLILKYFT